MFKKVLADISQLDVIGSTQFGIPVTDKIVTKEQYAFLDPSFEEKCILKGVNQIGEFEQKDKISPVFSELSVNNFYIYALVSALMKKSQDMLNARLGEEKEPEKEKKDERIETALKEWTEKNKDDDKLVATTYYLSPATRYYSGKQGNYIAENANLDQLSNEELVTLINLCLTAKGDASSKAKGVKNSPWVKERIDYTPNGWRQRKKFEYEKMYSLGLINKDDYKNKMEWAESFDFKPGWNIPAKEDNAKFETLDHLSEGAIICLLEFNKYFCLNAINKDKLFLEVK